MKLPLRLISFITPPVRGADAYAGASHFGAPRGDHKHTGLDIACYPGSIIYSTVSGVVTKLGWPYGDDLSYRYVEVTSEDGYRHRFFYVESHLKSGERVAVGDPLGEVQDLGKRYPPKEGRAIISHVHYEIKNASGDFVDPEVWAEESGQGIEL